MKKLGLFLGLLLSVVATPEAAFSAHFNNGQLVEQNQTITTANGVTALSAGSPMFSRFVGTLNQSVKLPNATTLAQTGVKFMISNAGSGTVSIYAQDGTTLLKSLPTNTAGMFFCTDNSSANGVWDSNLFVGSGTGTVQSVGMTTPSWLSVSPSTITTSGTFAITGSSQSANTVLAAPHGSSGAMSPRPLDFSDLTGNIAVGQMNSGTGASSSTCFHGDGTWGTCGSGSITGPGTTSVGDVAVWNATNGTVLKDSSVTISGSTITGTLSGNASTATALASTPTVCSGNNWSLGIATNGNASCSQPGFSNLSGSLAASQLPAFTGDVTTSAGSSATTIASGAVTNAKMANMAAHTYKGNNTGSTAAPTDVAASSVLADISPLTTKGDTFVYGSANTRQAVPGDYGALVPDSSQATGWRSASYTQLNGRPGKNYIQYADFENNATTGWGLGHVALTSNFPSGTPTFGNSCAAGSGGSNAALSCSTVSGSHVEGTYSLSYVSGLSLTAGDFIASNAYTIDPSDQARVLSFKFNYEIGSGSATLVGNSTNSFGVAIYDVTNSAWIQPAGVWNLAQATGVGTAQGTFQTPNNMTSFRLVIFNANATSSVTMYFDSFYVGPQAMAFGPAMTDFQTYTVSITGSTSNPTKGTTSIDQGYYRREGDSVHIKYEYYQTGAGTAGSGIYYFSLPSGLSVDTTKLNSSGTNITQSLGSAIAYNGTTVWAGSVMYGTSTAVAVQLTTGLLGSSNVTLSGTTAKIGFEAIVPISGWSSNTAMSSDTDTRVISASYTQSSTAVTASQPINFSTLVFDNAGAVTTGASWKFTAPVTGYYDILINSSVRSSGTGNSLLVYKNGSNTGQALLSWNVAGFNTSGVAQVQLNAGDYIDIRCDASITITPGTLTITRRSGSATVAASDSVNMRYTNSAGTSIGTGLAALTFPTKVYDSNGSYDGTTYTCSISGRYHVQASIITAALTLTTSQALTLDVYYDGALYGMLDYRLGNGAAGVNYAASGGDTIYCLAGHTIAIYASSGVATTLLTTAADNHISIERVGN